VKVLARVRIGAWRPGKKPPMRVCGGGAPIRPKDRPISQ